MNEVFEEKRRRSRGRKHRRIVFAIAMLLAFAVAGRFRGELERFVRGAEERATVTHAIDGDTVILADGRHVRYIGMNSPELDSTTARTRDLAYRAKDFNASLVEGKSVRLEYDRVRKDKYGRTLAYVYVGGECAGARLVAEGLARAEFFGDNERHLGEYKKIEAAAKAKGIGIWAAH